MTVNKITRKALLARQKGIVNLIGFLFVEFSLKIICILFLLLFITDYIFHYEIMDTVEITKSIWNAASVSIVIGLIPVLILGIYIEYIHPEEK